MTVLLTAKMRKQIEVQIAAASNIAEVVSIFQATRVANLSYLPRLHTSQEDFNFFSGHVFECDQVAIVAEEKKITGHGAFREGWIGHLYVLPEYQRRNRAVAEGGADMPKLTTLAISER